MAVEAVRDVEDGDVPRRVFSVSALAAAAAKPLPSSVGSEAGSAPFHLPNCRRPAQPLEVWDGSWSALQVNLEVRRASQLSCLGSVKDTE